MIIPPIPPQSTSTIPTVPFYSQFHDIQKTSWQKVGCGITSLAMMIDYYTPNAVSVNNLLLQGITSGAYDKSAGWIHTGLIKLSQKYGLDGKSYDLSSKDKEIAFTEFKKYVAGGPVMASVHYKFDPLSPIPHIVVIDGVDGDTIYYNDPAAKNGKKHISKADFLKGWKKKFIVIRPIPVKVAKIKEVKTLAQE